MSKTITRPSYEERKTFVSLAYSLVNDRAERLKLALDKAKQEYTHAVILSVHKDAEYIRERRRMIETQKALIEQVRAKPSIQKFGWMSDSGEMHVSTTQFEQDYKRKHLLSHADVKSSIFTAKSREEIVKLIEAIKA